MSKELVKAMAVLEEEKGISPEIIIEALESALVLAYKKNYDQAQNVEVHFDDKTGKINVYTVKEVVEEVEDETLEVSLEDAHEKNIHYEIGDKINFEITPADFGRIATQTAKHVIMQRIREAERDLIYNEYIQYEDEVLTGTVERMDPRGNVFVNIGRIEAVMPRSEQIPTEELDFEDRVKVYVASVDRTNRGPQVVVSRSHAGFLRRLFEVEVPEVYDGIVEIVNMAREAGDRSKVAVRSRDETIDPIGTVVGQGGQRIQAIVNELNGENMDIIEWDEDPAVFVRNAMNPAEVVDVIFEDEGNACIVVVPDYQLSLAIGKRGQNARLAARLTSYKIDIKSETAYAEYLQEQEAIRDQLDAESLEEDGLEMAVDMDGELLDDDIQQIIGEDAEDLLRRQDDIDEGVVTPLEFEEEMTEESDAERLQRLAEDNGEETIDPMDDLGE
ncbi:transcription termination factor NusA [Dolosicoccus paucivorans]|uniref:transcription termination factor NusA n=1 Tax=Dolosicoccus paucivorans TaxID=84521 RepID=UPI000882E1E3|nr:transcription termination factor NusA [Dolosicoccus paucivorans]SDI91462.1 NusA antitermination factor [Dolosicoccus paucivorans]